MQRQFIPGDQVRFLNEVGGGTVIRQLPSGQVLVATSDGFEIPVQAKELVLAFKPSTGSRQDRQQEPEHAPRPVQQTRHVQSPKPSETKDAFPRNLDPAIIPAALVGIVPENPGPVFSSDLLCYLINNSPYFAYFRFGKQEGGYFTHLGAGLLEPETKHLTAVFSQNAMGRISGFHIQLIWLSSGRYERLPVVDQVIDISGMQFPKESYYRENDYFERSAILLPLSGRHEDYLEELPVLHGGYLAEKIETDSNRPVNPPSTLTKSDTYEIDLHADALVIENSMIPESGILSLQIARFHSAMHEALQDKYRKLVVIHGVGQGTLKNEIRKELKEKYPNFVFQDASFKEYGFGATMVYLTHDKRQ